LNGWVSYWQPHGDSELGMAIVAAPGSYLGSELVETETPDMSHIYLKLAVKDSNAVYYTGFAWKESAQYPDASSWQAYLTQFAQNLKTPLVVSVQ
jgi:hypothetical protein